MIDGTTIIENKFAFSKVWQHGLLKKFRFDARPFTWQKYPNFAPVQKHDGNVAEWLGSALQKLLQRFESARYLASCQCDSFFIWRMLTKDEQQFLDYWRVQRTKKRRI